MLLNLIFFITLGLFALIASQPLFYALAFRKVSLRLKVSGYIEVRNHLDEVLQARLRKLYYAALASCLLLLLMALLQLQPRLVIAVLVALLALIADITISLRGNVPINSLIRTWTPENHPANWKLYRERWLSIYRYRQIIGIIGFASLLAAAIFS